MISLKAINQSLICHLVFSVKREQDIRIGAQWVRKERIYIHSLKDLRDIRVGTHQSMDQFIMYPFKLFPDRDVLLS